jgi:hypothetical protein
MCDYSLMEVPNRLAEEGEHLQVYSFHTGTKGLVSPTSLPVRECRSFWQKVKNFFAADTGTPICAVCVPPGAQLRLHDIPDSLQRQFSVSSSEEVMFTQLHADAGYHRDAIRFSNGQTLLLQRLKPGQRVDVVCLTLAESVDEWQPQVTRSVHEMAGV